MLVKEFLDEFLRIHRGRYIPHDWPEPGSDEWIQYRRLWMDAFIAKNVQKHEADTASVRCAPNPPRFRNDHLPRILNEIEALRLANQILDVPDDRTQAMELSKDCPHCSANGWHLVYHPRYIGRGVVEMVINGKRFRQAASVATICDCAFGRWMRNHIDKETQILELRKVLDGQSRWNYFDPLEPDPDEEGAPRTIQEILDLGVRLRVHTA